MITWLLAAAAWAADPSFWVGEWGLDPSRSDDGSRAIEQAFVMPVATTTSTSRQLAPDGGQADAEGDRDKALRDAMSLLGRSGRCGLAADGDTGVSVDWGDGLKTEVPLGGKWTRVQPADGPTYRIRINASPTVLVVERRYKTTTLTESWLPPSEASSSERVVVVQIVGPSLTDGVEFRRVYRRLDG